MKKYTHNKITYELIHTEQNFELYKDVNREHYELLKLRVYNTDKVFPTGKVQKAGTIRYPSNSDWGQYGWSFISLEAAMVKLKELLVKKSPE